MKKSSKIPLILGLSLAVVLVLMIATIATAASVTPTFHAGNTPSDGDLKTGDPSLGSTDYTGTGSISLLPYDITITVTAYAPEGEQLAFESNDPDVNVLKVWMKGGDNYYEYYYGPDGVQSDSGLICPNNAGGKVPTISHVVFFFVAAPEVTTTTEEVTTTTLEEVTTTTEEVTTTTLEEVTTTTEEVTTTTEEVTTTTEEVTTTTVGDLEDTTTTVGDLTTVSLIQTGGGGTAGPGAGTYALGVFALALLGGLAWTTFRPALKRK
jgi:hypothetical protein